MRLLDTRSLALIEVLNTSEVAYAILSHRWEEEEVSYRDIQDLTHASKLKGFEKIRKACGQAVKDGFHHIWIDTCCINKDSSAELSEAINSMFQWYKHAGLCYAFLADIVVGKPFPSFQCLIEAEIAEVMTSTWFTRGWTLQELIAPLQVHFFNAFWDFLGTKQSLCYAVSNRTGIDTKVLLGGSPEFRSVAQRMSWAASRVTTRVEDTAYFLMGIFDVNMALLYGEGAKAFLRLQEEIIKQTDDQTIFAWPIQRPFQPGLLADSPQAFADCGDLRVAPERRGRSPFAMTNRGLAINFMATPLEVDTYLVRLACTKQSYNDLVCTRCGIFLRRLAEDDQYERVTHQRKTILKLHSADGFSKPGSGLSQGCRPVRAIQAHIRQRNLDFRAPSDAKRINGYRVGMLALPGYSRGESPVFALEWNADTCIMSVPPGDDTGMIGNIAINDPASPIKVIKLGFDFDFNPVCFVATSSHHHTENDSELDQATDIGCCQYAYDWADWSITDICEGGTLRAQEVADHTGFYALKGDRLDGLLVELTGVARIHLKKGYQPSMGGVYWEFQLEPPI